MLKFNTERQIAIFDVDGVIVENPPETWGRNNTISDPNFWMKHWIYPEKAKIQEEMVTLAQSLISTGVHVIFMTARPEIYREYTVRLLRMAGFLVNMTPVGLISSLTTRPELVMMPGDEILSSAAWKQNNVAEWLSNGAKIMLFVEDYQWNCEAIRAFVPVLLYERKKISRKQSSTFPCCGGLSACWCHVGNPIKGDSIASDAQALPQVGGPTGTHRT